MQPIVEYAQSHLGRLAAQYRAVVEALPDEALNWRPTATGTNSVAQLVRHVAFGQRMLLTWALGTPPVPPFDERTRGLHDDPATRDELLAILADLDGARADLLVQLDAIDLTERVPSPMGPPPARLALVAHAVGEAREHIGHAELTRQLWEARV